ncbi:MAG: hypothetical protein NTW27_14155 [Deltaproteobacteria bacterium]|nr:hypothetical protein [Deltaproteobacteria bacterium]
MHSIQNSEEKHKHHHSKVKDLLDDIRSGLNEDTLLTKHYVTLIRLQELGNMLGDLDMGSSTGAIIQGPEELNGCGLENGQALEAEESSFMCPSCLTSQHTMFDICPNCSVSFLETIDQESQKTHKLAQTIAIESSLNGPSLGETKQSDDSLAVITRHTVQPSRSDPVTEPRASVEKDKKETTIVSKEERATPSQRAYTDDSSIPRRPSSHVAKSRAISPLPGVRCDSCKGRMAPALRNIYDRSRSMHSLVMAGICFAFGFVGSLCLSFFDGPSLGRLTVFYITGIIVLFGAVFSLVGAFLYLAREKVYFCPRCKRSYPRADISYLAAALAWSSRPTSGTSG